MITIRPFANTDADYEILAALSMAIWPEYPDTVEELKHRDHTRPEGYIFHRFFAEKEGQAVASGVYLQPWWSMKPGKFYVNCEVHPDHRRQGIGTALYDHLMDLVAKHDPVFIVSSTREDQADAIRFLTERGFRQVMRAPVSHLDVAKFDAAPFAARLERVRDLGIDIRSMAKVAAADPDWKQKFYDLDWELLEDVPSPDPLTRQPFEVFEERLLGAPGFNPDAQFIALDGDQWVGLSGLWMAQGDPERLYTGLTGVVRSHRRKGIATAMKVRAIGFARQYGARLIETDNEENNPMYQLNMQLGFEPQPAWLDFEKHIEEEKGC